MKLFHVAPLTILYVENVVWDSGMFHFLQVQVLNAWFPALTCLLPNIKVWCLCSWGARCTKQLQENTYVCVHLYKKAFYIVKISDLH